MARKIQTIRFHEHYRVTIFQVGKSIHATIISEGFEFRSLKQFSKSILADIEESLENVFQHTFGNHAQVMHIRCVKSHTDTSKKLLIAILHGYEN